MAINLEDQLVFYRSYHFNTINVLIHSVFVPTIMFSSFGYATNVRIPIPIPHLAKYLNLGVLGHGVFEKRAPALLDNLLQALVLAPFFILFELFFLLGFRTDLKKRVDARVEVNIANFRAKKK
ncbi:unnamed protein product [Wickerhamomyces anomalus]